MDVRYNQISFNKTPAFRGEVTENATPPVYVKDLSQNTASDKLEKTEKPEQQEETGVVQKFKNGVAAVRKFFISTNSYVGAAISGTFKGIILGSVLYTGFNIAARKKANIGIIKKAICITAGIGALGLSLYQASLNISKKKSDIDHKYNTGHNNK